jgi:Ni2+-binding GTPase involved in maturation of urease and hydrogenase
MKLFLVGGFLGSGKTTAIRQAARSYLKDGIRVAVVTNDQGSDLVDTAFIKYSGIIAREVINGCFCCNYSQLTQTISSLRKTERPEIIFAESVGSCTDLVATIAKPIAQFNPELPVVISVFVDAQLLYSLITGNASFLSDDVRYIYKKQLEEADILVINKIDLLKDSEIRYVREHIGIEYAGKKLIYQNSLEENSISNWVLLLNSYQVRKDRISLDLDYDRYAKGEAILAWVDQRITVTTTDYTAHFVALGLVRAINSNIRKASYPIAHLKFLWDDGIEQRKISFTTLENDSKEVLSTDNGRNKIEILLNARIQVEFATLERLISESIEQTVKQTGGKINVYKKAAFQPAYPRPTHRML